MSATKAATPGPREIAARLATGLLGGWLFTCGFVCLGTVLLMRGAAFDFEDAQSLAFLLAFLVFLIVLLWSFAAARLARTASLLFGSGALMTALAWWLSHTP